MRNRVIKSVRLGIWAGFVIAATFGALAQDKPADGPQNVKATLLRPGGWIANWRIPGDEGRSEIVFQAHGDKIVAKIRNLTYVGHDCERDVTIKSDTVNFDGCLDYAISLRFDAKDKNYPFKGKSGKGYEYKVQPKEVG